MAAQSAAPRRHSLLESKRPRNSMAAQLGAIPCPRAGQCATAARTRQQAAAGRHNHSPQGTLAAQEQTGSNAGRGRATPARIGAATRYREPACCEPGGKPGQCGGKPQCRGRQNWKPPGPERRRSAEHHRFRRTIEQSQRPSQQRTRGARVWEPPVAVVALARLRKAADAPTGNPHDKEKHMNSAKMNTPRTMILSLRHRGIPPATPLKPRWMRRKNHERRPRNRNRKHLTPRSRPRMP